MDQGRQGAVAFAGQLDRLAVAEQARAAADLAVAAFGLESLELPRRGALDIFAPEHSLQLGAGDFAGQAVHLLVGDGAKLALHVFRQLDAVFTLQQVGDAPFA